MLERITFEHFFIETKEKMPQYMMATISPGMAFFKCGGTYLALNFINDICEISSLLRVYKDKHDAVDELLKSLINTNVVYIRFWTKNQIVLNIGNNIYEKYGEKISEEVIENYYGNESAHKLVYKMRKHGDF